MMGHGGAEVNLRVRSSLPGLAAVCLLKKLMGPFDEATNISMANGSAKSHAPIAPQLFHFRPSNYTSLLLENLHNYHGFA